ncbi:alpha,alpha-phosphotrehalase [Lachnoclostridium sp. An131]|uniref:alpha,alpha-phosphotrehalase n=1 Tax=Lachnoclostridium sp. An131 TaxID=1965555 RepID=UPI000B36A5FA|nr:alpha,alpha-phosphotrehalase [Lachnoclostridium sp. An131]OUQ23357.1 alpha,alpha-phosphotrehalase [Lachnoclostridium sp. An131]
MAQDFKKSTVYQIYPKSFCDSNGDGFGDLRGVIGKLDYLQKLGVDYIWMTPFFVSPQNDNGYDVEDYYNIDPRYGTMEDLEELIAEAGKRGIRLMFDMVFNHVSSRHEWFRKAMEGDSYYKDFFFFRKGKENGEPPTNWESKFGGNAWEYVEKFDEYYLHLFHVTQPDLNWDNENVRKELQKVIRFWMEKGVKGFRFDVVNLISKSCFEDDETGDGRKYYTDGPNVHKYLHELNQATFGTDAEIITVGEMSSTSIENCYSYAGADTQELSMVFSFHHLKVDFMGNEKWVLVPADFGKLKDILFTWQTKMEEHHAWNAVFWCNHDQPRPVSRFGNEGSLWKESAKMLGTVIHCMRGTPYIYQGEEIGMTNTDFTDISQFRDVESLNYYQILQDKGLAARDALRIVQIHSRDNGRTPMQWDDSKYAGFTDAASEQEPWIGVNANHDRINAASQVEDEDSIFNHYRKLVRMRKELDVIAYGSFLPLAEKHPSVLAYRRTYEKQDLIVVNNFYGKECTWKSGLDMEGYRCILSNYADGNPASEDGVWTLRPYESMVWYKERT